MELKGLELQLENCSNDLKAEGKELQKKKTLLELVVERSLVICNYMPYLETFS